ncbi:3-phenylpropionate/trans-cinnamate dioxygenase ferredoxin reductase subunit [Kibdelosporangium banguiense]|uniref:3-phenylpropionate/trans-cinnamate dioxygenase ferredoxin reductase subunit n=1 Tax=Kibdelosporangium banguiense TaxID=1365924 RepID=A0ABS4T8J8_9PSEU|nr:FAD-dependent oxidoreductase [Kibdelosporangium banguiense]MBP2320420.1 3-phenylpropionate/trans-cinnamate dioxygenase ferredoxin reductase subunit [Kibdelosporangium banguiense]
MSRTLHHVIIGGSAAGVAAAFSMRASGFEGRITIVDAGTDEPYERPPLSKTFEDLGTPRPIVPSESYVDHGIDLVLGVRATVLDEQRHRVRLDNGEDLFADAVLLATGVSPRRLGIAGEDLGNVLGLRDIHDARAMSDRLDAGGHLVIIGGGFIGLEAAAVARRRGLDVTVVEAMPMPLIGVLGTGLAAIIMQRMHTSEGVRILTGRTAMEFRGGPEVEEVLLDDGTRLEAATVLVGCGVAPNDRLAREAGVHTDAGIVTDDHGRTSNRWIWAAGDVANYVSPYTGRRQRIEHWDVAQRHGTAVGANMAGLQVINTETPYFWSDQYGKRLQMYGRAEAGDRLVMRSTPSGDGFLAFWLRGDRLVASAGIDQPKELRATKPLIENRVPVRAAQLADPAVSLRRLGRTRV